MAEEDTSRNLQNSFKFQAEDTPTKYSFNRRNTFQLGKRKVLFSHHSNDHLCKRSKSDAEAFSDYSPTEDSNNSSLETLVQEHALKFWNLGASWNDSEITSSDSTLPPLASAKELPEDIRDELKPTPLAEMLAQDLYATAFTESMPEDALMLRVDSKSPWVQHLSIFGGNKVPLIHVADQQERTLPRQHSSNHHGMLDETDAIPSTNYFISDLELPRQNSSEENMRQQVLHLLWDVGALRPSDWEAIDSSTKGYLAAGN